MKVYNIGIFSYVYIIFCFYIWDCWYNYSVITYKIVKEILV